MNILRANHPSLLERVDNATHSEQKVNPMVDDQLFEQYYDEYFDKVNRYLRYRAKNHWDADDLTTQVFIKAFENLNQCNNAQSFGAWIFRIAHNTFIDYVRKKKELPMGESQDFMTHVATTDELPENQLLFNEMTNELHGCLLKLPADQRDVVMLRYFGDLKIAEIAEVLQKTESSIKMLSYRGIRNLRSRWEEGVHHEEKE